MEDEDSSTSFGNPAATFGPLIGGITDFVGISWDAKSHEADESSERDMQLVIIHCRQLIDGSTVISKCLPSKDTQTTVTTRYCYHPEGTYCTLQFAFQSSCIIYASASISYTRSWPHGVTATYK